MTSWKINSDQVLRNAKEDGTNLLVSVRFSLKTELTPKALRIVQGHCSLITRFHVGNVAAACCTFYT